MNSLKDISLKSYYWSDEDDILLDFYIPALSVSKTYKRIAGYFSSTTLAVAAKGLAAFIHNGGKMFLITSVVLSGEDKDSIEKSIEKCEKKVIEEIDNIEDELIKNHVAMLGWMIKNGTLEIKIAVVPKGIFHPKIGILEDLHNRLSFSGSENETAAGWLHNDEAFHVFKSWETESDHLGGDLHIFESLWNGRGKRTAVYSISKAFEKKLIQIAPKDKKEFTRLSESITEQLLCKLKEGIEKKELYDYQKQAIDAWKNNGCKGILEMATGTGKTFTSLNMIKDVCEKTEKLLCVITVPYLFLVTQWKKEFLKLFGQEFFIKEAHSEVSGWEDSINEFIQEYDMDVVKKVAIFTVYDTFASEKFQGLIHKYLSKGDEIMLVSDEVHFLGAPNFSNGMKDIYKYRLGLSATPQRWFDEEGSKNLIEYFGGTVFKFLIKEAIPKFLTPYNYFPQIVQMSNDELEQYCELAEKISKTFHFSGKDNDFKDNNYLTKLLIERAKIIVNNEEKKSKFHDIILDLKKRKLVDHLLIYCSPEQLDWAQEALAKHHISNHKFTFHENQEKRAAILSHFENGTVKALVAMRCLDQGLDMPSTKIAIILASSTNPIQYIQRRGRVLRKYPGKKEALIYDFIVVPGIGSRLNADLFNIEQKVFCRELARVKEFYEAANNKADVLSKILPLMDRYKAYF